MQVGHKVVSSFNISGETTSCSIYITLFYAYSKCDTAANLKLTSSEQVPG